MKTDPDWLRGLTRKDWLFDGGSCSEEQWAGLDWSTAWMDCGPSITGNPGPYWHVMDKDGDCQHRLYPKVLQSKWLLVIQQALREAQALKR